MDICYWEEFIVDIHFLLHLVHNTRASRTIIQGLPVNLCIDLVKHQDVHKLRVIILAVCVTKISKSKAIHGTNLYGTYKLPHSWVTA